MISPFHPFLHENLATAICIDSLITLEAIRSLHSSNVDDVVGRSNPVSLRDFKCLFDGLGISESRNNEKPKFKRDLTGLSDWLHSVELEERSDSKPTFERWQLVDPSK
jgi:hypothetical protein